MKLKKTSALVHKILKGDFGKASLTQSLMVQFVIISWTTGPR